MRQFLSILGMVLLSMSIFGQLTRVVSYYDETGLKTKIKNMYYIDPLRGNALQGRFLQFFESGELAIKGQYKSNIPSGEWKYFFESGLIKNRALLESASKGYWWYYYEQGGVKKEGALVNSQEQGVWKYYYENQGLRKIGSYRDGFKEGDWRYFYEDSVRKGEAFYEHNQGIYREYYYQGTLKMEGPVQDDLPEGMWTYYYEDGMVKAQGLELSGEKSGFWKYYYNSGELLKEGRYVLGKPVGEWKEFTVSGKIYAKGGYGNGARQGDWSYFDDEGKETVVVFENNVGLYKEYYPNGNLKARGELLGGKREGKWLYLYPNGAKKGECDYSDNEGEYTGYFEDGKLESKGLLIGDKKEGIWELHDKKGQVVYLRTIYSQSSRSIVQERAVDAALDSVLIKNIADAAVQTKSNKVFKYKPLKKWRVGKRWAISKANETRGFLVTIDPMSLFTNSVKGDVEYFIQERQGWTFGGGYYNGQINLFGNGNDVSGYEINSLFKIYSRNTVFGMTSIGPLFRYKYFSDKIAESSSSERLELCVSIGKTFIKSFKQNSLALKGSIDLGVGNDFRRSQGLYPAYEVRFGIGWLFR